MGFAAGNQCNRRFGHGQMAETGDLWQLEQNDGRCSFMRNGFAGTITTDH